MKNSLEKQQNFIFLICYIVIACFSLVDVNYRLRFLRYPFEVLLVPVNIVQVQASKLFYYPVFIIESVFQSQQIISDLQQKNAKLMATNAQAVLLQQENEQLKREIEKKASQQLPTEEFNLTAHLISLAPVSYIDKGEREGVRTQDLIMSQGVLLGKIQEVDHFFSSALFFDQSAWEIVARTQSGVKGIIKGNHGKVYFTQIPADQRLEKDELLITAGTAAESVPPGLLIGRVDQVIQDPGQPFQTAIVDQSIDLSALPIVQIVRW